MEDSGGGKDEAWSKNENWEFPVDRSYSGFIYRNY